MKNKVKNISVISTGSWVPSNLNDQEVKTPSYKILDKKLSFECVNWNSRI